VWQNRMNKSPSRADRRPLSREWKIPELEAWRDGRATSTMNSVPRTSPFSRGCPKDRVLPKEALIEAWGRIRAICPAEDSRSSMIAVFEKCTERRGGPTTCYSE
jgi:hypothetical protein